MTSQMLLLAAVAFIVCFSLTSGEKRYLNANYRTAYVRGGIPTIREAMTNDTTRLTTAYDAYKPVNATCHEISGQAATECTTCIGAQCTKRAKRVCRPSLPSVPPTCSEIRSNSSYYCLYYANDDVCAACIPELGTPECKKCITEGCQARLKEVCPPTRPTVVPTCADLQSNSSWYCRYYAHPDQCSDCTNASDACISCVNSSCIARYVDVCPPTKPSVEPGCSELKENATFNCRYYIDSNECPECTKEGNATLCAGCVSNRCKARYLDTCPLARPTTAPACDLLKNNASYGCLYYAEAGHCSHCVGSGLLTEQCHSCIKTKCKARAEDVCGNFITDTIKFFSQDVPDFFTSTIPDTVTSVGNEIVGFGKNTLGDIANFGANIGSELATFGQDVGRFGDNLGQGFLTAGTGVFDSVIDPAANGIEQIFTGAIPQLAVKVGQEFDSFFANELPGALGGVVGDIGTGIGTGIDLAGGVVGDIGTGIGTGIDLAGGVVGDIGTGIDTGIDLAGGVVGDIGKGLDTGIDLAGGIVGDIGKGLDTGIDLAGGIVGDIGKGLDTGIDLAGGIVGEIGGVLDGAIDLGGSVIDNVQGGLDTAVGAGSDIIGDIGGGFNTGLGAARDFFGGRKRRAVLAEPGCADIKASSQACLYYNNPQTCTTCQFNATAQCPGWGAAVADLRRALALRAWVQARKTNGNYVITSVAYDTTKETLVTNTFTDVEVALNLFGRNFNFTIAEAIKLTDAKEAGAAIAKAAVKLSRAAAAA